MPKRQARASRFALGLPRATVEVEEERLDQRGERSLRLRRLP